MDRREFMRAAALFGVLALPARAAVVSRLVVIVHPRSPVSKLGAGDIEALFTTRKLDWPDGRRAVPFNFPARHPIREAFDRRALQLDPDEAARFWIDRRVRGGHPPPRQLPDVTTMVRVVAALETAVGYAQREDVTANVRVVAEI